MDRMRPPAGAEPDEAQLVRLGAIIDSMTPAERRNHRLVNGSRRKRIARGSGTTVEDVNRLLRQFAEMRKMIKAVGGLAGSGRRPSVRQVWQRLDRLRVQ